MLALAWLAVRGRGTSRGDDEERGPRPDGGSMIALGDTLLRGGMIDEDAGGAGAPARYRLDGLPVGAIGGRSAASFERVLAEAEARCAADAAIDPRALASALRSLDGEHESRGAEAGGAGAGGTIETAIEGDHGFVACLDRHAPPPGRGALRYAYARRDGSGARFVVVWTETVVRLVDLEAPEPRADVPGEDVPGVPRPPGARRRFSFAREGSADHMAIYDASEARVPLEQWASEALPGAGWSAPRASGGEGADRVLIADREGRRVHLVLGADGTMVVIATAR